ncbi:MAG: methyltransferase domain-containing protein, partial [Intrasporangiaceae bacterium]|nr:methyltransferase domain-containing protein [Intrasporangiaceae bacterium]
KRPGWQDPRWIHLLGPVEVPGGPAESAAQAALDLDAPTTEGAKARDAAVLAHFEAAADAATRRDPSPFESWLLDRVIDLADGRPVIDAACGAGHVAGELATRGAVVSGSDVSPAMVEKARQAYPSVDFETRDLRRLMRPAGADGWGVTLAFGVLDLFAESELVDVLTALTRPLTQTGYAVLTCTVGPDVVTGDGPVRVHHDPAVVLAAARRVGLTDLEWFRHGAEGDGPETLCLFARRPCVSGPGPRGC